MKQQNKIKKSPNQRLVRLWRKKSQPKAGPLLAENKGFSLVETLIAVVIFSIAMTTIVGAFSSFLKNYANNKKMQKDIENAQYAMNIMAKTLRTSSLVTTTFPFNVYDYSQRKCIQFSYVSNKIRVATTKNVSPANPAACGWGVANMNSPSDLTSDSITGALISAIKTTGNVFGVVTLSLKVQSGAPSAIPIQMSVSLRQ